jgi:anti-anti-sigma factor
VKEAADRASPSRDAGRTRASRGREAMAIQVEERSGAVVLRLDSSYSAFNDELLNEAERTMLAAVEASPTPRVVLDFTQTEYFSSMFIEVLFRVWNRVRKKGGRFVLCGLHPVCREILTTAKLDSIWEIRPTVDEAITACSE